MAQEVQTVPTTSLNHFRIRDLGNRLFDVIEKNHSDNLSLTTIADDLKLHCDSLERAQNREWGSSITEQRNVSDEIRDGYITGFFDGIEYNLKHFKEDRRNSAELLWKTVQKQNSRIHNEPDAVETLMIETLLSDLDTPEHRAALTTVDLAEYIPLISEENQNFIALTNERALQKSEQDTPLVIPTRRLLHQSLRTLKEYLTLLNRLNPSHYERSVDEINAHIAEVAALAKSEKSRESSIVAE